MATRNIVPRADGEGSLGTSVKKWGAVHVGNLTVSGTATGVTPTAGDDSTKLATTEYVQNELSQFTVFDVNGKLVFPNGTTMWIENVGS